MRRWQSPKASVLPPKRNTGNCRRGIQLSVTLPPSLQLHSLASTTDTESSLPGTRLILLLPHNVTAGLDQVVLLLMNNYLRSDKFTIRKPGEHGDRGPEAQENETSGENQWDQQQAAAELS